MRPTVMRAKTSSLVVLVGALAVATWLALAPPGRGRPVVAPRLEPTEFIAPDTPAATVLPDAPSAGLAESRALAALAEVRGRVVTREGRGLAGVRIVARGVAEPGQPRPHATLVTESQADGAFVLDVLDHARVDLEASAPDWVMEPGDGRAIAAGSEGVLLHMSSRAVVTGVVVDFERRPVRDALVFAARGTSGLGRRIDTRSGDDGAFILSPLGSGAHVLGALHPDHGSTTLVLELVEGTTRDGVVVVLAVGASLGGLVTSTDGTPIPGAEVRVVLDRPRVERPDLGAVSTLTDVEGAFRIIGLDQAVYAMTVTHADHLPWGPISCPADQETLTIVLQLAARVRGTVIDPDGDPVFAATIAGYDRPDAAARYETHTDADGIYVCASVAPGPLELQARHPEFLASAREAIVTTGGVETQAPPLALRPGLWIKGRVVDEAERPVPGAAVSVSIEPSPARQSAIDGRDARTHSDSSGGFRLGPLEDSQRGRVLVTRRGYTTLDHAIDIEPGRPLVLVLFPDRELQGKAHDSEDAPAETVEEIMLGLVVGPGGEAVAGATVEAGIAGTAPHPVATSDALGHFEFRVAARSSLAVWARYGDYATPSAAFPQPGIPVRLQLVRLGSISGRVVDEDAVAVQSFQVSTSSGAVANFLTTDGRFEIPVTQSAAHWGRDTLFISASGFMRLTHDLRVLEVWSGNDVGTLILDRGETIAGVVVSRDSEAPLAAATVTLDLDDVRAQGREHDLAGIPQATTDDLGAFVLNGVPRTAIIKLRGSCPGYEDLVVDLVAKHTDLSDVTIALVPETSLFGVISFQTGDPMSGVVVLGQRAREETDAETPPAAATKFRVLAGTAGEYLAGKLAPGRWRIEVRDPSDDFLLYSADRTLTAGTRTRLDF